MKIIGDGMLRAPNANAATDKTAGGVTTVIFVIQREINANVETNKKIGDAINVTRITDQGQFANAEISNDFFYLHQNLLFVEKYNKIALIVISKQIK